MKTTNEQLFNNFVKLRDEYLLTKREDLKPVLSGLLETIGSEVPYAQFKAWCISDFHSHNVLYVPDLNFTFVFQNTGNDISECDKYREAMAWSAGYAYLAGTKFWWEE